MDGNTQLLFLRSQNRVSGSTDNAFFNISPPIERGKNWKVLSWSGLPLVGPLNNGYVDVQFSFSTAFDPGADVAPTVIPPTRIYPALQNLVQPLGPYADYCGFFSDEPNYTATNKADNFISTGSPTSCAWLYTNFSMPGYVETTGNQPPSSYSQLLACIQFSIRRAIAQGIASYMTASFPPYAPGVQPQSCAGNILDLERGFAGMNVPPQSSIDFDQGRLFVQKYGSSGPGPGIYYIGEVTRWDSWVVDIPSLFHIVAPGATVTHVSTTSATQAPNDGTAPLATDPLLAGSTYTYTNNTSRVAFVFMPDDGLAVRAAQTFLGIGVNTPYFFAPFLTALSFRVHGNVASVLGLPQDTWIGVGGMALAPPFEGSVFGFSDLRVPRWPLRTAFGDYSGSTLPDFCTNQFYVQSGAFGSITVPAAMAYYASTIALYQPPVLDMFCSLLIDHQTMTTSNVGGTTTLCLQIPLGESANNVVSYLNTTADFSNTVRQELISQFSVSFKLDSGEPLNSLQTLPPGVDGTTADGALFVGFPDWTAEIAFTDTGGSSA